MEETKTVKLALSVADLKKNIDILRDAVVKAKATGENFTQQLSELRSEQAKLDEAMKLGKEDVKAYNSEMKAAQKEIKGYESAMLSVEKYSEKWYEYARAAGTLKDNIKDAKDAAKAFASDTRGMDNVLGVAKAGVAAFGLWTSALAAFGVENEKVVQSIQKLQAVTTALSSIQQIQNALMNKSVGIGLLWNKALLALGIREKATAVETTGLAGATTTYKSATEGAKTATQAMDAVLKKTVWGVVLAAVAAAIALVIANWDKLVAKFKSGKKEVDETAKTFEEVDKQAKNLYNSTLTNLQAKYKQLSSEWKTLASNHEKNEWIKKNQTEFKNLGLSIKDANDAEKWMVEKSADVINAFKLRAQAAAEAARMVGLYGKANELVDQATERYNMLKKKEGDKATASDFNKGKATYNQRTGEYEFTKEGAAEYNKELFKSDKILAGMYDQYDQINKQIDKSAEKYANLNAQVNNLNRTTTTHTNNVNDEIKKLNEAAGKDLEKAQQERDKAKHEAQLQFNQGLITEMQLREKNLEIDKKYAEGLNKLKETYKDNADLRVKFESAATEQIWANEEEEAKIAADNAKNAFNNAISDIKNKAAEETQAAWEKFEQKTATMEVGSEGYKKAKEKLNEELKAIDDKYREQEKLEVTNYYDELIRKAEGNAELQEELERLKQNKLTEIAKKGMKERSEAMKDTFEEENNWTKLYNNKYFKASLKLSQSISALMGSIGDVMEEDLNRKVKNGEMSEELAKEEYERIKKVRLAELWISTLAGATGAFVKDMGAYAFPFNAIIAGVDLATTLAAGIAQTKQIKSMEFDSAASGSGGETGVPTVQDVQVSPLLNQRLDSQDMTAMNTAELVNNQTQQRVYIYQSDIEKSNKQVQTRVSQSTF